MSIPVENTWVKVFVNLKDDTQLVVKPVLESAPAGQAVDQLAERLTELLATRRFVAFDVETNGVAMVRIVNVDEIADVAVRK